MKTKEQIADDLGYPTESGWHISHEDVLKAMQQFSDQNTAPLLECLRELVAIVNFADDKGLMIINTDDRESIDKAKQLLSNYTDRDKIERE